MKGDEAAGRYFAAFERALSGFATYLREEDSAVWRQDSLGATVEEYLSRLRGSFECWRNRVAFADRFSINQAESGFPAFQHVLELHNDGRDAKRRLAAMPDGDTIRREMADFILKKKEFPAALQKTMAERRYLETAMSATVFSPLCLPRTVGVGVNAKTGRPAYLVHWGWFDGAANLPLIYLATIEDSSSDVVDTLVARDGTLNRKVDIPLPVEGLLNPALANRFDGFCERNSAYSLSLSTIATSLDTDFDELHPKSLRRIVLGPFYHADITRHGENVDKILQKVHRPENQWVMTWTLQEIWSVAEKPAKRGIFGGEPARQSFHINTDDLECARMGCSAYQRHALVPHEAYQAIYAAGEQDKIFSGFETHIITGNQVLRRV
jgi:hypothetical protein